MKDNNIDKDEHILSQVVLTKSDDLIYLLNIIDKHGNISQADLRRKSKFSMGKIYPAVKSLKSMEVVDNGKGIRINENGKSLLLAYNTDKLQFKEILKKSFLKVPLFRDIYEKNRDETNFKVLFSLFKKELETKYKDVGIRFIGSAVRRYLEGVHDIKLKAGLGINIIENSDNNKTKKVFIKKNSEDKISCFKSLKRNWDLSDKQILQMIDILPKEKKDEIYSIVFSKVI